MNDVKIVEDWGIRIIVLERGFVYVGHLFKENNYFTLKNGYCIRKWGTSEGLGELAEEGKRSETILDKTPILNFHEQQCIFTIKCNILKWKECGE